MNLEELQKKFGADTVTFRKGPGEFTTAIIDNGAAEAEICLHGAHLMKFVPAGAVPVLWMSKIELVRTNRPIRGGVRSAGRTSARRRTRRCRPTASPGFRSGTSRKSIPLKKG